MSVDITAFATPHTGTVLCSNQLQPIKRLFILRNLRSDMYDKH